MKNHILRPFLFVLMLFVMFSCKKVDEIVPTIKVGSPRENASFNISDSITVKASISDDLNLDWVSVRLVDASLKPAHTALNFEPTDKEFSLNIKYPLDNEKLESGEYFIKIMASDGQNEKSEFVKIQLVNTAILERGVYVLSGNTSNNQILTLLKNNGEQENILTLSGDYQASAFSHTHGNFARIGQFNGDLISFNTKTKTQNFSVENIGNPPFPYFSAIDVDANKVYVGLYNGEIRGYNSFGVQEINAKTVAQNIPYQIVSNNDIIGVVEQTRNGQSFYLSSYHTFSGASFNQNLTNFTTLKMIASGNGKFLIVGKTSNESKLVFYTWEPANNRLQKTADFKGSGDVINDFISGNGSVGYLAVSNRLYEVEFDGDEVNEIPITLLNIKSLSYEPNFKEIVVASSNTIIVLEADSKSEIRRFSGRVSNILKVF